MALETALQTGFDHLGLRDRVLALRALEPIAPLGNEELTMIAEHATPRYFEEGDYLLREGLDSDWVHIILHGLVRSSREGRVLAEVQPGYGVGFLTGLAGIPGGVDAIALEHTHTLEVPISVILDSFEQSFTATRNGLRLTSRSILNVRGCLPRLDRGIEPEVGVYPETQRTFVEKLIEMRKSPMFQTTNFDAVVDLVRRSTEVRGKAGDVLWRRGDPALHFVKVDYGLVDCTNGSGESVTVGSGFVVGVMESMAAVPRQFEAVARTDYVTTRTEISVFLSVLESHHSLARLIQKGMSMTLLAGGTDEDPLDP